MRIWISLLIYFIVVLTGLKICEYTNGVPVPEITDESTRAGVVCFVFIWFSFWAGILEIYVAKQGLRNDIIDELIGK